MSDLPDGNYLGFDFGLKRIGLASGNTTTHTAQPLTTIANRGGVPDWPALDTLIEQWRPVAMVVGLPLTEDGKSQPMTAHARGFMRQLRKRYDCAVYPADERYTSFSAERQIAEQRAQGKRRSTTAREDIDKMAACLLLEGFFQDPRPPTETP